MELLRNRLSTPRRRGRNNLPRLLSGRCLPEGARTRVVQPLECDYEAMNSWHLRKYSTQVVSYTKRTF